MFCQKCGTQNPDDGKFCIKCGKDLKSTSQVERTGISGKLGKMGIPGFRSGKTWKMIVAIFGYFFIFMILLAMLSPSPTQHSNTAIPAQIATPVPKQIITATATPEPTPILNTPTIKTPIIIEKSGTGQTATKIFYLQQGLARVTLTYTDTSEYGSNFIVQLLDENGRDVGGSLANEIGSYTGTKAIRIDRSGNYLLDVMAKGNWNVKIEN